MVLRFSGNAPSQKYIHVGVMGNNNTDELTLVLDKAQGKIDLSEFEPSIKITNRNLTFADKTKHFIFDTDSSLKSVFITYRIPEKVTRQKNIDMQIVFEHPDDAGVLVWQSQIFNVTFGDVLNVSGVIEKEYPDILKDYDKRITAVESKVVGITQCIDRAHFPDKGIENIIYVDLSDGMQYLYDTVKGEYGIIGLDPDDIKIINCNGGN